MSRAAVRTTATLTSAALFLAALVVVGGLIAGYRPVVVTTGSMGEAAPAGSLVIAGPEPGTAIETGDIVVLTRPGAMPVTHRVLEIEQAGTSRFAITKGDANEAPDSSPYPLSTADELTARWVLPGWGSRLQMLLQPAVLFVVVAATLISTLVSVLRMIWRSPATDATRSTDRRRRRSLLLLGLVPLFAASTVGVAWAVFTSRDSVAQNVFTTPECFDAQLGSVQNGETVHATDGSLEVAITPVDPTEAFVLASVRAPSNTPSDSLVAVSLRDDGEAVVINRATDTLPAPAVSVSWSIIHYACGVSVQRGTATGTDQAMLDIAIGGADPSRSFAVVTAATDPALTVYGGTTSFAAAVESTSSLRIRSHPSAVLPRGTTYAWQVVTFDDPGDILVQQASTSIAAGATETNLALPTAVDPASTFVLVDVVGALSTPETGARLVRADLESASTIAVNRGVSGEALMVHAQVVTLRDGSTVRHGTVDLGAGVAATALPIDPVAPGRSTAISTVTLGGAAAGGLSADGFADLGEAAATFVVADATTVDIERSTDATDASFGWQLIEWAGPTWWNPVTAVFPYRQRIDIAAGSVDAPDAYTVPLTFDHAALLASGLAQSQPGDDIRVMRWNGTDWTELDRVLDENSGWNETTTTIWFRTQEPLPAETTVSYWLYFGDATPGAPADDPENVWLLTENFESGSLGDFADRTGDTAWYVADPWTRRVPLTIPAGRVSASLVDHTVLVAITNADLAANAQLDGDDFRFVDADGVTPLDHEIERWDPVAGELVAWVRVPVVNSASNTSLSLLYGAADAPNQSEVRTTWSTDAVAVWHMADEPGGAAPQLDDSTTANLDGIAAGGLGSSDLVVGLIGDAVRFDGVTDHFRAAVFDLAGRNELTISAWIRPSAGATQTGSVFAKTSGASTIADLAITPAGAVAATLSLDGVPIVATTADGAVSASTWHHIAAVWDGIDLLVAVDGSIAATAPATGTTDADATMPVTIGARDGGAAAFAGEIDELRIDGVAHSIGWLAAAVDNHRDPDAFVVAGAAQSGTWFDQGSWGARKPIVIAAEVTDAPLTDVTLPITIVDADLASSVAADGADLVFTTADGVTRLDHAVEVWDPGSGSLTAWVRLPSISADDPTELFLYYDNPAAADQQDPAAVFGNDSDLVVTAS